jgi:ATP-dependent Clp protease adaptor protein ClpS
MPDEMARNLSRRGGSFGRMNPRPHGSLAQRGSFIVSHESSLPDVLVAPKPKVGEATRTRRLPPYNVILENDSYHSFEFVMGVLVKVLGCTPERAYQLTWQAHTSGRSIIWTGPKEVAELKVEQVRTFHEVRAAGDTDLGPLGCSMEPAPGA